MQESESESKSLLSVQQASERLGISQTKVRDLIASGRLRAINLADPGSQRCYRIKPEWIDNLITESEIEAPKPRAKQSQSQNLRPSKYATIRRHT
jgi:excisionase family DNA binding protein